METWFRLKRICNFEQKLWKGFSFTHYLFQVSHKESSGIERSFTLKENVIGSASISNC